MRKDASMLLTFVTTMTLFLTLEEATLAQQSEQPNVVPLRTISKLSMDKRYETVSGDPAKAGAPFVIRIHAEAGYIIMPHTMAEKIRTEADYFERNAERMRYPRFRRQHLFVGSGVIEAKTVIGLAKSLPEFPAPASWTGPMSTVSEISSLAKEPLQLCVVPHGNLLLRPR